ncbi:Gfo/Idh/MocA family protein [uncultured Marinococcus sp.]|uniref:Gfo/Idh/MocA family protein n=1 Tax=uncultured Marinococcus sp. TaxID=487012 RepID=UPI0026071BCB|nr:Gfo/Idh/MocA family oxidoreductase [uncultured Marinococcus sp.]
MESTKWGILSTAAITTKYVIPALQASANAKLKAIASSNEKAEEIAREYSIEKHYSDYDALLDDPEIDVVYIPLPNSLHAEWVKKAAEKGKNILCEKPAALTVREVKEMYEVCEKNNVLCLEALMYQFQPQHERVKQIIQSGEIGEVKLMRAGMSFMLEQLDGNIRMNKELGGGSVYDLGCYCIHAVRSMTGSEPATVHAFENKHPEYGVDMSAFVSMKMENGMNASFDCSMEMSGTRQFYEIVGTKGTIEVPKAFVPPEDGVGAVRINLDSGIKREENVSGYSYIQGIEYFSGSIVERADINRFKQDSVANMRAVEACLKSIAQKAPVSLNLGGIGV